MSSEEFDFRSYGQRRADIRFVADRMKPKRHMENTIGIMCNWIKNNGHRL
jgi:hypothetical protein